MKITKEMFQSLIEQMNRDTSLVVNEEGQLANSYPMGWLGKIQDEIIDGADQESAALLSSFIKKNMPVIRQVVMAYIEKGTITEEQAADLTIEFISMVAYKVCKVAHETVLLQKDIGNDASMEGSSTQ
jgi:hypothetical protein